MADIKYLVEVDATGAVKSVKNFEGVLAGLEKGSEGAEKKHNSLWKDVALGQLAFQAATKIGRGFVDFLKSSITAAMEAEDSENNLRAALEATGRSVEPLVKHYVDLSAELQNATVYEDDQIQSTQALLLQMTKLDREGIDKATKGAIGLASVFKMDLQSAGSLVAKAMAGNTAALSRYGITVDQNLSPQEKQNAILEKLISFYPRAEAETNTFSGALKQLGNTWDDMKENVGGAVTKSEGARDLIKTINRIIVEFGPELKGYMSDLAGFVSGIANVIEWTLTQMQRLKERVGGLSSDLSEEERAWIKLNEVMGGYSTVSDTIVDILRAQGMGAKDLEKTVDTLTQAWQDHGANTTETLKAILAGKYGEKIKAAFEQAAGAGVAAVKKFETAKGPIKELGKVFGDTGDDASKARKKLTDAAQAIIDKARPLAAAVRKIREEEETLNAARVAGLITAEQHAAGIGHLRVEYNNLVVPIASATDALLKFAEAGGNKVIPGIRDIQTTTQKATFSISKSWGDAAADWVKKNEDGLNKTFELTTTITAGIDAIIQQSMNNKMIALDQEYQTRLEFIKNSLMSEEEKNKAIEGLDAEYDIKRKGLLRAAAQQGKMVAIANAIINVAEGMTKALAQGGIFGPVLAGVIAAFGAVQIALIRAQPIPLKEGAIFRKPVFSQGGDYEAGEAGPEAIIPLRELPRIMRELSGGRGGGGGFGSNRPIIIQNRIILDGREMKAWTTKTVRTAGALGKFGTLGKEFANA